ncbi:phosphoglycerate mutase family protein [Tasmannia lanceolata]|uniref:phosphoglycerate mutase family protein n=1 Tax=Tasmannia lanceolata TaxID=3420 RepID=UPI004064ABA5
MRSITPCPSKPFCKKKNLFHFSKQKRISSRSRQNQFFIVQSTPFEMANLSICNSDSMRSSDPVCNDIGRFDSVPSDFAEIIVVRHGETTWNACGRIQGHLDAELNDVGRQQAAAVADRLSKESKISAVYSSDLKRAFETAQIIAKSCDLLEVTQDSTLRERHLGDLQGLVLREAAKIKTKAYQAFLSPKTDQEIPGGGESLDQLYHRCTSSLERIASKHKGERVVVVTHGGVLRALYKRAAPKGSSQGKVMNASVNIFHLSDSGDWVIKTWGDVSHLGESGFLKNAFGGDRTSG